ncbi:hypothetical protein EMM73_07605 [Rheinheimera sediminis]|nr:hypothetical protein EMM73_07605 [Rheinheimera sp. YQF-1]
MRNRKSAESPVKLKLRSAALFLRQFIGLWLLLGVTIARAEASKKLSYPTVRELSAFYAVPAMSSEVEESTGSVLV